MKNSLIRKMFIILITTVLAVAAGVYGIVYTMSYNAMLSDIRDRANGVRDYIIATLSIEDIVAIGEDSEAGSLARLRVNEILGLLSGVGNIKHLYIARVDEEGSLYTSISVMQQSGNSYIPSGEIAEDLHRSLREQVQITGSGVYQTDHGSVYTVFWPVMNNVQEIIGVVGMEFDVDNVYSSYRAMAMYSLVLSVALIVLFSIIAFLSMSKASEPFYKKLAYTDLLTGYENRMAFEQRLREAADMLERGKSVTLMIFDVNNLKIVNDTAGHKQGDTYLKNTADVLVQHIGAAGSLYRIGGDEFATIFVGRGKDEVQKILDSIRTEKSVMLKNFPFSCACGAATFEKGIDKSLRDVFGRADKAMYEEKKRQKSQEGQQQSQLELGTR